MWALAAKLQQGKLKPKQRGGQRSYAVMSIGDTERRAVQISDTSGVRRRR